MEQFFKIGFLGLTLNRIHRLPIWILPQLLGHVDTNQKIWSLASCVKLTMLHIHVDTPEPLQPTIAVSLLLSRRLCRRP